MNPQQLAINLSVQTMFNYDNHMNIPWNISEYQPKKEYLDPLNQILQKKFSTQKKGQKNNKYVTKRGFYMDYDLKVAKSIPSAFNYTMKDEWDGTTLKNKSSKEKVNKKLIKYTYLEKIEMQQQKRKIPGVCTYNLNKSEAEIKEQLKKSMTKKNSVGQKRYFYQDTEYLANLSPGAGAHNPHVSFLIKSRKLNPNMKIIELIPNIGQQNIKNNLKHTEKKNYPSLISEHISHFQCYLKLSAKILKFQKKNLKKNMDLVKTKNLTIQENQKQRIKKNKFVRHQHPITHLQIGQQNRNKRNKVKNTKRIGQIEQAAGYQKVFTIDDDQMHQLFKFLDVVKNQIQLVIYNNYKQNM